MIIKREGLKELINDYLDDCYLKDKKPSYNSLGKFIGVTHTTISHYISGYYRKGKPYEDIPNNARKVHNNDFDLIRNVFVDQEDKDNG